MGKKILSPKSDLIFKLVLGSPGNLKALKNFLMNVLDYPPEEYDEILFADPILKPESIDAKTCIMDIKIITGSKKIINIEMQRRRLPDLIARLFFYAAGLYREQLGRGKNYSLLEEVACIVITDHIEFRDKKRWACLISAYETRLVFSPVSLKRCENTVVRKLSEQVFHTFRTAP